jgi:hypothetical protein
MAVRLSASRTGIGTHFCRRLSEPKSLVRLKGIDKLIKIIHLSERQLSRLQLPPSAPVFDEFNFVKYSESNSL